MARAAALLLALSLPAVSTLRPPPRPPSRRQQQPLLSRGALLRGALAAATARVLPAVAEEGAEAFKASAVPDSIIGEIPASGLIFKDIVKVSRFSDPKVEGVELYVSDFQLPMTERLTQGDIFSDPLSSSVTCVQTGPIKLDPSIKAENTLQGEEVVSQARSLLFKSVKVRPPLYGGTRALSDVALSSPGAPAVRRGDQHDRVRLHRHRHPSRHRSVASSTVP